MAVRHRNNRRRRISAKTKLVLLGILALVAAVSLVAVTLPAHSSGLPAASKAGLKPEPPVTISGPGSQGVWAKSATAPGVPGPVNQLGSVWHIGPDGPLPKRVTIRLPLNHPVPAGERNLVFVFTRESLHSGAWTPLPTKVSGDGRFAAVTVNRLSWFTPLELDVQASLGVMKEVFDSLTGGAYTSPDAPQCPSHTQALQGYNVVNQGQDAFLWCFGQNAKGTRIVKVVSNRRYALLLTHQAMSVMSSSVGNYLQAVGRLLSPTGLVLYPRDTATFNADEPPGGFGKVVSDVGGEAQLMSSLDVGLKALLAIVTKFGYSQAPTTAMDILDKTLTVDACRASTPDPVAMVANCFSPKELVGAFGPVWGVLLVPLMTVSSVVDYFHGAINGFLDQFNHRSQFGVGVHNITTATANGNGGGSGGGPGSGGNSGPAAPTDQFLGKWNHHTTVLYIRPNLAGTLTLNMGPCRYYDPTRFSPDDPTMCQEDAYLQFAPDDNGLAGTVTKAAITEWHGFDSPATVVSTDDTKMAVHLNASFRVYPYLQGVLHMLGTGFGMDTMCKLGPNGHEDIGPGLSETQLCGA